MEIAISNNNIEFDKANAKLLSDAWLFAKERSRSLEVIGKSLNADPNDEKINQTIYKYSFSAFFN